MKSSAKKLPKSKYELLIKVDASELETFFDQALKKVANTASIKGFRKGRAPKDVVIKEVGRSTIEQEALDIAMSDTYFLALKEHKLSPIAHPEIEIKKYQATSAQPDDISLEFVAKIVVMPEVKLKDIDRIKVAKVVGQPATDEEVQKVIDNLRRQKAIYKEVKREAQNGDWVDIGYSGSINGVDQPAMKNEHHPVILGEGSLIPGFEEHIVGLKAGDSTKFKIKFPKSYHAQDVAGKTAEFTLKLHELKEVILPAYDVEFTKDFGFNDIAQMRKEIAKNLTKEKEQDAVLETQNAVMQEFEKRIIAEIPDEMYSQEVDRMVHDLQHKVEAQGMKWDQYLNSLKRDVDQIKQDLLPQARQNVKIGLGLGVLVKEKNIDIKDENMIALQAVDWLVKHATSS